MAKRQRSSSRRGGRRSRPRSSEVNSPDVTSLPSLDTLSDLPAFEDLSVPGQVLTDFSLAVDEIVTAGEAAPEELALGCVARLDRGFPAVLTEGQVFRAEFAASLTKGDFSRAAVGDWVCVRMPDGHDQGLLLRILPRRSDVARWRGSNRGEKQTLAANVDVVLAVQALDRGLVSCERMVRAAVVARDCGTDVAFVLTKADRAGAETLREDVAHVRSVLGEDVRLVITSSAAGDDEAAELRAVAEKCGADWGEDGVRSIVAPGTVAIVIGESGAGKSTLLNALLGHEALETGAVRESDDAGRHTTVARRMVALPGAGVIVDEPGLRSLPLVGHERGLAKVFPDISAAATGCRFRDCTHTHEPGCEVLESFSRGEFPKERLDAYLALAKEMRESASMLDPDIVL